MSGVLIVIGLAGYAVFFLWRVRVEEGWVGISAGRRAILRLVGGVKLVELAIGEGLIPAVRLATEKMRRFSEKSGWIYVGVDPGPPFENGFANAYVDPDGTIHIEGGAK